MNRINPNKLLQSKWTCLAPSNNERHFMVVRLDRDDQGKLVDCLIEAVLSKRQSHIDWHQLKDNTKWQQGWR